MPDKTLRCAVERLERGTAYLDVGGHEVAFPRAALPTPLEEGDVIVLTIQRDGASHERDEQEAMADEALSGRRLGKRVRGNPRSESTRLKKK